MDIRQLLTYCALNYESTQYDIGEVSIVNPRLGTEYRCSLEDLSQRCARLPAFEILTAISAFLQDLVDAHQVT